MPSSTPEPTPRPAPPPRRRRLIVAFQLVVAAALVGALVFALDWRQVAATLLAARPAPLAGAAAALAAVVALGAFDVRLLLGAFSPLSYAQVLRIYVVSWSSFLAMPGSAGDAVQVLLLRDARVDYRQASAVYLVDKLISLLASTLVAVVGVAVFFRGELGGWLVPALGSGWWVWALAAALGLAALGWALARAARRSRIAFLARARARVSEVLVATAELARRHPGRIAGNFAGTLLKLTIGALPYWLVLRALGVDLSPLLVLVITYSAGLVAYLPVAFNGVGTVELAALALYGSRGVSGEVILATYLLVRGLVLLLALAGLAMVGSTRRRLPDR